MLHDKIRCGRNQHSGLVHCDLGDCTYSERASEINALREVRAVYLRPLKMVPSAGNIHAKYHLR